VLSALQQLFDEQSPRCATGAHYKNCHFFSLPNWCQLPSSPDATPHAVQSLNHRHRWNADVNGSELSALFSEPFEFFE
jgi:hypothetical protein